MNYSRWGTGGRGGGGGGEDILQNLIQGLSVDGLSDSEDTAIQ